MVKGMMWLKDDWDISLLDVHDGYISKEWQAYSHPYFHFPSFLFQLCREYILLMSWASVKSDLIMITVL